MCTENEKCDEVKTMSSELTDEEVRDRVDLVARMETWLRNTFSTFDIPFESGMAAMQYVLCEAALRMSSITKEQFIETMSSAWDFKEAQRSREMKRSLKATLEEQLTKLGLKVEDIKVIEVPKGKTLEETMADVKAGRIPEPAAEPAGH